MSSVVEQVCALCDEASALGHTEPAIAKAEEAVRVADAAQDDKAGFIARMQLAESATFGGYPEKALVAFGWCLAKHKMDEEKFPAKRFFGTDLLWMYKWITLQIPAFSQIARAQIVGALDDMTQTYEKFGLSLRPVFMNRARAMRAMGDDPSQAHEVYRKYQWAARDRYADCRACEVNFEIETHAQRGDHAAALAAARPILAGEMGCAEVPHVTYPWLFEALRAQGDDAEADRIDAAGYALIRDNRDFVGEIARHAHYRMDRGRLEDARTILERHVGWARGNRIERRTLDYWVALARLYAQSAPGTTSTVRNDEGRTEPEPVEVLAAHYAAEAEKIAARFDARNGNTFVSDTVTQRLKDS